MHAGVGRGVGQRGGAWNTRLDWEIRAEGGYSSITADDLSEIRDRLARDFEIEQYRPK